MATWPQFEELPREDDSAQGSQGTERSRLTKDEIMLLREFIALLDEWDRKSKTMIVVSALQLLLFFFVSWLITSRLLLFYLEQTQPLAKFVDREWEKFNHRFVQPPDGLP